MISGVLYALLAGLMWGLILSAVDRAGIPGDVQSMGRYLALGLIALPIAWLGTRASASVGASRLAYRLDAHYDGQPHLLLLLASAIQRTGSACFLR